MTDRITVTLGITKNLGDYNSARVDAQYETDVRVDESIEGAYERAWNIVDEQVASQLDDKES